VTATEAQSVGLDPQFLKSLDPALVGAAASKLFSASVGDIVVVLSRSPAHKHYSLADIEWMVLPPVAAGQFYVAEAADKQRGFRAPIAVVTWAFVSEEVDQRLQSHLSHRIRLRPDEWKSGDIGWIVDIVGSPAGAREVLAWLKAGPFKKRNAKIALRDAQGQARVDILDWPQEAPGPEAGAT
jgi:hemolysin-activating ACP:hemolysin acyltransferase